ncbi:hypothetical protein QBD01_000715 [Ochrobactrum sp. 19YEA23]|nr:hypothetical protein [Ochrobactrum sp. P6BSIII]MBA8837431.1 hypothetical protein [Ochrobactrum sp. RH2CCR150]MDH7784715.1 hypothetical protein [Ochrobactrum sp. 19YEA23]
MTSLSLEYGEGRTEIHFYAGLDLLISQTGLTYGDNSD